MAWSFRRRVKVGGMNLNLSRSGLGVSAGAGPFRFGVDAKGRHYTSVRGPFGLYNRQYHTPSAPAAPEPQPQQFVAAAAKSSAYLLVVAGLFIVFAVQDSQPFWFLAALLAVMWKRISLLLLLFLLTALASARDKPENWLEVRSQHFIVVTNANEKAALGIADQFERMRTVFHVMLPHLSNETDSPIIVLAIRDEADFRALEPQVYLAKGQLKLGGLFLRTPDKNYVLMRVDAAGEHPYSVIYHEYTHFIARKEAEWLPLWLNEGLAEFYENTDIHEKDVTLGQPSPENLVVVAPPVAAAGDPVHRRYQFALLPRGKQRLHLLCRVVGADPLPLGKGLSGKDAALERLRGTGEAEGGPGDRSYSRVR
jgi:uncharacterized protein DUF4236